MRQTNYNPDVLSCLANLSNDEVFTPPVIVNQMLDLLPAELWRNPDATFLDPACKSGIFLREIAKRLMAGLAEVIPDEQKRANHIFTKQLYGISITELTALLSRRSVYCSKRANGKYSICTEFGDEQGNIRYTRLSHTWERGRCRFCGASQEVYDRGDESESYAYQFIHTNNPEKIFNMRFDVIIGNPPYQLSDGGGTDDSAKSIYHLFIQQALKLDPSYLCMIIPSRWMKGGKGLTTFRMQMMNDIHIKRVVDFENAQECFVGLHIDGGVCYFLRDKFYNGKTKYTLYTKDKEIIVSDRYLSTTLSDTIIRDYRQISIIEKVKKGTNKTFNTIVSSRKPFGIATDLFNKPQLYVHLNLSLAFVDGYLKIYGVKGKKGGAKRIVGYVDPKAIIHGIENIDKYKLFYSYAYSTDATVPPEIIVGKPGEISTETFLLIGGFEKEQYAINCLSYIKTKFFRALLQFNRIQKNVSNQTFSLIPLQDFSEPWTDEKLYKKYNLTAEEIAFIESMIRPME